MTAKQLYWNTMTKARIRWERTLCEPMIQCRADIEQEELIKLIQRLMDEKDGPLSASQEAVE